MDKDLSKICHKDIDKLLLKNPTIKTLIYTSNFVKGQMHKKFGVYHTKSKKVLREYKVRINETDYKVIILYSPSRNALRGMGSNGKDKRRDQYKKVFG